MKTQVTKLIAHSPWLIALIISISCNHSKPQPIKLNHDSCSFCKMTIANGIFAAELITPKGRFYKFDDLSCMIQYIKSESLTIPTKNLFVSNYLKGNEFVPVEKAFFIKGENINSPMRGNIAVFASKEEQKQYQEKFNAQRFTWEQIYNTYK